MLAVMLRFCYTLLFTLAQPFLVLRLWWRGHKNPAYRRRIHERFALGLPSCAQPSIWIHAVSVGESMAAIPLVHALRARFPEQHIVITTTTPTGSARIQAVLGDTVQHVYMPFDLPWILRRFLNHFQVTQLIVMETEIWPNVLHVCQAKSIPVIFANARVSPRSFKRYQQLARILPQLFAQMTHVFAQSTVDEARFLSLGVSRDRLTMAGNLKFEMRLDEEQKKQGRTFKTQLGQRFIWVAGSTHEGEEALILEAHQKLLVDVPEALLIIVPRHPERFMKVASLCEASTLSLMLRSQQTLPEAHTQIYLADTMGEMNIFLSAANVAFIGGSLVPIGGHNLLEPAALGVPSLTGPHLFNFLEISQVLIEAGASKVVESVDALAAQLKRLSQDTAECQRMGEAGLKVTADNTGACETIVGWIRPSHR